MQTLVTVNMTRIESDCEGKNAMNGNLSTTLHSMQHSKT